jgi:hypothetical protein
LLSVRPNLSLDISGFLLLDLCLCCCLVTGNMPSRLQSTVQYKS